MPIATIKFLCSALFNLFSFTFTSYQLANLPPGRATTLSRSSSSLPRIMMPTTVPHSHTLAVEGFRNPFSGTGKSVLVSTFPTEGEGSPPKPP
jgi:hypothetical protein